MDLGTLSSDQLLQLTHQLDGLTDTSGRSALRPRQLHDLNRPPAADDPRPLFIWSAAQPKDYVPGPAKYFPALLWHRETGEEITVHSAAERADYGEEWISTPPAAAVPDPFGDMQAALDLLSADDRALLIESQRQDRMRVLQAKLAALPQAQLEALLAGQAEPIAKRGPGRPKKAVA